MKLLMGRRSLLVSSLFVVIYLASGTAMGADEDEKNPIPEEFLKKP